MGYIFGRIKNSLFYKKYIKELGITKWARSVRDELRRYADRLNEVFKGQGKYPDLTTAFSNVYDDKAFFSKKERESLADADVDIVVPVFNGYEYLVKLLPNLLLTKVRTHIYIVDDASTDLRIAPLLAEFADRHDNVTIITNETNLGFVKSVNRALLMTKYHVALVNSDTELPGRWLERLMMPILLDKRVASTTPFTNSATIFSFPDFPMNNDIYMGLDVKKIDAYFSRVIPRYTTVPTGVGFCMGMSNTAIDHVGLFDAEAFDRGYGEENDWCMRAKRMGFRHVFVENLFVYHKHGGSFRSEEKQQLIDAHMQTLRNRYPRYESSVGRFIRKDPVRDLRDIVQILIDTHEKRSLLYFSHDFGEGADAYLMGQVDKYLDPFTCVSTVKYSVKKKKYIFTFYNDTCVKNYYFTDIAGIENLFSYLSFDEVYVNDLVEYPSVGAHLDLISDYAKTSDAKLTMLMHDYFALCPGIIMTPKNRAFCEDSTVKECEECFKKYYNYPKYECSNPASWRAMWKDFLLKCDEVRCFSRDTMDRVLRHFGSEVKLTLLPHQVDYIDNIDKQYKTTNTLNIGVLGVLSTHKGGEVVKRMLAHINDAGLNINIVHLGTRLDVDIPQSEHYICHGAYDVCELPSLVYKYDIDLFFISSIWPETFSYTTQEAVRMNMPVCCYDIGAPAERIREYARGCVIDFNPAGYNEMIAKSFKPKESDFALETLHCIRDFAKKDGIVCPATSRQGIVCISEYKSYSSRYRLLHMAEELQHQGYPVDIFEEKMPREYDFSDTYALVCYRTRYLGEIKRMIDEAQAQNVKVIYDIDDVIFDYANMTHIPNLDENVYGNFEEYSSLLKECMDRADMVTVSTDHMALAVNRTFPGKPVYVNRNVASYAMSILSEKALEGKTTDKKYITLGYFSGSNTHNEDFESIANVLKNILCAHSNVRLKLVGALDLPDALNGFDERIIRLPMQPWQSLPKIIADIDINLMPLIDNDFNRCKSEIKWMEAGMVKTPTIASYNAEIAGCTHDGTDIVLCKSEAEWESALSELISDSDKRKAIASAAYLYMRNNKRTQCSSEALVAKI